MASTARFGASRARASGADRRDARSIVGSRALARGGARRAGAASTIDRDGSGHGDATTREDDRASDGARDDDGDGRR